MHDPIFKAYDIRGIYPTELDEPTANTIGLAFAHMLSEELPTRPLTIAVGRDARLSSPQLHAAFIQGVQQGGVNVDDLGLVPSELVYFAVGKYGYAGGAVITASHNPKEYNGIRMIDQDCRMRSGTALRSWMTAHPDHAPTASTGELHQRSLVTEYVEHALTFIDREKLRPLTIVVDAGNGMAGVTIPELFRRIPGKLIGLNLELDGHFPNRPPNPLLPESQTATRARVLAESADLGVIFDGDADRVMFVTERGEWIRGDIGLLLLAKHFLKKFPGTGVAYNVVCSRVVGEKIAAWGGRPLRTPVGFVNVSGALRKQDGVLGGETSAHYCFRDNYYADSGLIALLTVLQILSETDQPLSQLVADFNPYHRVEHYFTVQDKASVIDAIEKTYLNGTLDRLDGLTVEFDDWWFNVRGSNTEPLLRVTVETERPAELPKRMTELAEIVAKFSQA